MDDADEILVNSLKSFGCDFDVSKRSLAQFTVDDAIKSALRCLHVLGWLKDVPAQELPLNTSAKFRLCNRIAQAIKTAGYDGELGYQTFLYLTDSELRNIFSFLVGKVPKDHDDVGDVGDFSDLKASLNVSIKSCVSNALKKSWVPWYCRGSIGETVVRCGFSASNFAFSENEGYGGEFRKLPCGEKPLLPSLVHSLALYESVGDQDIAGADVTSSKFVRLRKKLLENHAADYTKAVKSYGALVAEVEKIPSIVVLGLGGTHDSLETKMEPVRTSEARDDTEDVSQENQEERKAALEEELKSVSERLSKAQREVEKLGAKIKEAQNLVSTERAELEEKRKLYASQKRAFDFLPGARDNAETLSSVNAAAQIKLEQYETEWARKRQALMDEVDSVRAEWMRQTRSTDTLREELVHLEEREVSLSNEKKSKAAQIERLLAALKHRSRDTNRSVYTQRIFEIITSIQKQSDEIEKVLADTRTLQKSINMLEGKLDRSFTIADELIFRDAKKDEKIRRAYKNLAALREGYDTLISTVRDIGAMTREIRDLEDQVEQDKKKNIVSNLEGIQRDFAEMKAENAVLKGKLDA